MKFIITAALFIFMLLGTVPVTKAHRRGASSHVPISEPRSLKKGKMKKYSEVDGSAPDPHPAVFTPLKTLDDVFIYPEWGEPGVSKCGDHAKELVFYIDQAPKIGNCSEARNLIEDAWDKNNFILVKYGDSLDDLGRVFEFPYFDLYVEGMWQPISYLAENNVYDVKGFFGENYVKISLYHYVKMTDRCGGHETTVFEEYLAYCEGEGGKITELHRWRDSIGHDQYENWLEILYDQCLPGLIASNDFPPDIAQCYDWTNLN